MKRLIFLVLVLAALSVGCAETVVLLPDDQGHTGSVVVRPKEGGQAVLDQPYTAVDATDTSVGDPYQLSQEEVAKRYAETLAAQPEPPARFILYFKFDTATLLPDSKTLLDAVMQAYQDRSSIDVSVVGHTDRSGDRQYNFDLSKKRAEKVAKLLTEMGMDPAVMDITSHGEENPLIPTEDDVLEPRNRRVEVTVR